jgi:ethanolamine utilization microcompartment shell protein EutL
MGKSSTDQDKAARTHRKLEKARLKLAIAEEQQAQARERGKQAIQQARLQAAEWEAGAAERVQRRAQKVARAEERLRMHATADGGEPTAGPVAVPEDTVEILEVIEATLASDDSRTAIVLPGEEGAERLS